jgi:hypothetical protein
MRPGSQGGWKRKKTKLRSLRQNSVVMLAKPPVGTVDDSVGINPSSGSDEPRRNLPSASPGGENPKNPKPTKIREPRHKPVDREADGAPVQGNATTERQPSLLGLRARHGPAQCAA